MKEFKVSKVAAGEKAVFWIKGYNDTDVKNLEDGWNRIWKRAGIIPAPPFILTNGDVDIKALSDAEIRSAGLMRIPD